MTTGKLLKTSPRQRIEKWAVTFETHKENLQGGVRPEPTSGRELIKEERIRQKNTEG
jgi:hypothetical protein